MTPCPACGQQALGPGLREWHRRCTACGHEASTLQPHILEQVAGGELDEAARADALEPLRRRNFAQLAALVARLRAADANATYRPRLLDVGCAHGWFLEQVAADFDAEGIEPDIAVAGATRARGLAVRGGFFPDALRADERFDVIVFNDVLEHIVDLDATLAACVRHLRPGGLLVVNAPDRRGALYRISKWMLRVGADGPFERMWQKGYPSPHVHFFGTDGLLALAQRHALRPVARERLASLSASGLYARIRCSRDVSVPKALAITAGVTAAIPLLAVLPSDATAWVFRRDGVAALEKA